MYKIPYIFVYFTIKIQYCKHKLTISKNHKKNYTHTYKPHIAAEKNANKVKLQRVHKELKM